MHTVIRSAHAYPKHPDPANQPWSEPHALHKLHLALSIHKFAHFFATYPTFDCFPLRLAATAAMAPKLFRWNCLNMPRGFLGQVLAQRLQLRLQLWENGVGIMFCPRETWNFGGGWAILLGPLTQGARASLQKVRLLRAQSQCHPNCCLTWKNASSSCLKRYFWLFKLPRGRIPNTLLL